MFHLYANVSTVAPETAERKRASMLEQFESGQRERKAHVPIGPPTVGKWRSLAVLFPDLLREWHPRRNDGRDPYNTGPHSHRKVWWRCRTCGHEWQVSPHERTFARKGCPACERRRSIAATIQRNRSYTPPPERSFARRRPDLVGEWHPTRNGDVDPHTIAAGSESKVWWRCSTPDCGREWQAVVMDRTKGKPGCPACVYRRTGQKRARASSPPVARRAAPPPPRRMAPDPQRRPRSIHDQAGVRTPTVLALLILRTRMASTTNVTQTQPPWGLPDLRHPTRARREADAYELAASIAEEQATPLTCGRTGLGRADSKPAGARTLSRPVADRYGHAEPIRPYDGARPAAADLVALVHRHAESQPPHAAANAAAVGDGGDHASGLVGDVMCLVAEPPGY
jgi:hypothetical protein